MIILGFVALIISNIYTANDKGVSGVFWGVLALIVFSIDIFIG